MPVDRSLADISQPAFAAGPLTLPSPMARPAPVKEEICCA